MYKVPIKPPIIVNESGDIDVFESVEDAEQYLESMDVEKGLFEAYDSEGRALFLLPTSPRITIECAEWMPEHQQVVYELLFKFLGDVGVAKEYIKGKSLQDLVSISLNYKTT